MYRDMTFIDDIIDGIFGAIDYVSSVQNKNEIFNLGNDAPIKTNYLLSRIEQKLAKKAKYNPKEDRK